MPKEYAYFDVDFTWDGNFYVLELGSGPVAECPTYDRHEKMPMKAKFLKLLATKFDTIFILRSPSYMTVSKEFDFEKRTKEYLNFLDENEKKKFKLALSTDKISYDTTQKVVALFIDEGVFTEKNSVRYQKNYRKANFPLPVINGPSSCPVIARDKIVFSDFADIAKMPNKPLTQAMELHNWENSVESILANTKSNFLVIKPTNEAGGEGILVVHRDKLKMTLACLANPDKKLPEKIDDIEKQKYQYWREKKGNYNGFCLIQDYKPSKAVLHNNQSYLPTGRLFLFVTKNENGEVTIEIIDGYWKLPRIPAKTITTTSTVSYVYGKNSPYKRIDEADFKTIVQQCQTTLTPVMKLVFSTNHNRLLNNLLFNKNRLLVNYILKNNFEFLLPKDIHHAYNLFDLSIATEIFKHLPKEQEKYLWLKYLIKILSPSIFLKKLSFFDITLAAIKEDIETYSATELKEIETLLITIFNTLYNSPTTNLVMAEQIIALLKKLRGPALTLTIAKSYLNYAISLYEQNENSQLVKENYLRAIAVLSEISPPTPASNELLNNYQGYFADYLYLQGVKLMGIGKAQTLHIATEYSLETIKQAKTFFQEGMAISKKLPDQINGRINSIKYYTMANLYSGFAYIADKNNLQEMYDNFHLAVQEFEKIPNDGHRRENHDQQHTIIRQNYEHLLKQLTIEKNKTTKTAKKTATPPKTSELKSGFFQKEEKKKESNSQTSDLADYKDQIFADPELEFRQAAAKGDLKKVKYLLEISPQKISNIDCVGQGTTDKPPSGKTALHFAAEKGKCNVVKYLLGHKANLTKEDSQKATPLELAYQNTNEAATEILNYLFMNDMGNFIGGVYIKIIECEGKQFEAKVKSSVTDKVLTPAELLEFGNLIDISTNHLNKLRALLNNSDYKDDIIKICETAFNGFLDKKFHGLAKTQAVTLPELMNSISQLNSP